jgi:hypothetical protein
LTQNWVSPTTPAGQLTSARKTIGVSIERRAVFIGDVIFTDAHRATVDAPSMLDVVCSRSPAHPDDATTAHVTTLQTCAKLIMSPNVLHLKSPMIGMTTAIFVIAVPCSLDSASEVRQTLNWP